MKISWKNYRLRKTWEFQRIIKERKKVYDNQFIIYYSSYNNAVGNELHKKYCRFGITIPQRIVKKAVMRNKYKRQLRSIIIALEKKNYLKKFSKWDFLIVIKSDFTKNNFEKNKEQFKKLLDFFNWKNSKKEHGVNK